LAQGGENWISAAGWIPFAAASWTMVSALAGQL
jgi:hypothetical protein